MPGVTELLAFTDETRFKATMLSGSGPIVLLLYPRNSPANITSILKHFHRSDSGATSMYLDPSIGYESRQMTVRHNAWNADTEETL